MSEVENDLLDDYQQVGVGSPTDSYKQGTGKQLIDLTEYFDTTEQANVNSMVTGAEAFASGMVSRSDIVKLKLPDAHKYDPFPSERNARMGAEGFFGSIMDGFKKIIESIIRYIQMGIEWIVTHVKEFFGFQKTERQREAVRKAIPKLEDEYERTLAAFGIDKSLYDVQSLIENLGDELGRNDRLTIVVGKLQSDEEAIQALVDSIPLFKKVAQAIRRNSSNVTRAAKDLKRTIGEEANKLKVRKHDNHRDNSSKEAITVLTAINETEQVIADSGISDQVANLFKTIYGVEFKSSEKTNTNFKETIASINNFIVQRSISAVSVGNKGGIQDAIMKLDELYQDDLGREINLADVNWREVGRIVDMTDAEKIEYISKTTGDVSVRAAYAKLAAQLRTFTTESAIVTRELVRLEAKIQELILAQQRVKFYIMALVTNNWDAIEAVTEAALKSGHPNALDVKNGIPNPKYIEMFKGSGAQTTLEKFAADSKFMIDNDLAGLKTRVNAFAKQIGVRGL